MGELTVTAFTFRTKAGRTRAENQTKSGPRKGETKVREGIDELEIRAAEEVGITNGGLEKRIDKMQNLIHIVKGKTKN